MSYDAMQEQLDVAREINAQLVKKLAAIYAEINGLDFDRDDNIEFYRVCININDLLHGREVNNNDTEHQTPGS